jgi:hypothetical protein
MKITGTFSISGRGHGITTNEPFTEIAFQGARAKTKIRVSDAARVVELTIKSVEAVFAIKPERAKFIGFVVPAIADKSTEFFLQGKDIELR